LRIRPARLPLALIAAVWLSGSCADQAPLNPGNGGTRDTDSGGDAPADTAEADLAAQDQGGGDGTIDARPDSTPIDTGVAPWPTCVPHPLGEEICNNGFDDDCDGLIDEACGCTSGMSQACYPGDPRELDVPATGCRTGTQQCGLEFWEECVGAIGPVEEICGDGIDNNCNGEIDEGCGVEPPEAGCPADFTGPVLRSYTLTGSYSDPNGLPMAVGYWSQLSAPPGHSRDLVASGLQLTFFADVAGPYLFELTVENQAGERDTCQTRFEATTEDFVRIEMFWNPDYTGATPDTSDVDLLLRRNPVGTYAYYATTDTCYWNNCATCTEPYSVGDAVREVRCREFLAGSPPAGYPEGDPWPAPTLSWTPGGLETDPRLDLDDVEGFGPENINIRRPNAGTYRVAVHYYDADSFSSGGSSNATAYVRILCGGQEEYVSPGVVLQVRGTRSDFWSNDVWEVGDITITYAGEVPQCTFTPLGTPGSPRVCRLCDGNVGGCNGVGCSN
jgi:hypothetical protein